jgi:hypothetical protein
MAAIAVVILISNIGFALRLRKYGKDAAFQIARCRYMLCGLYRPPACSGFSAGNLYNAGGF